MMEAMLGDYSVYQVSYKRKHKQCKGIFAAAEAFSASLAGVGQFPEAVMQRCSDAVKGCAPVTQSVRA